MIENRRGRPGTFPQPIFPSNFGSAVLNFSTLSLLAEINALAVLSASVHMNDEPFFKSPSLCPFPHSTHRRLRVADILVAEEDEAEVHGGGCIGEFAMDGAGERRRRRDGSGAIHCHSFRRIVARLSAALRQAKLQRPKIQSQGREFESISLCTSRSMKGLSRDEDSGQYRSDTSFKLGVGCGLLSLMVASKNEFSKMVELRKEMEMLLQNVKEDMQRKDALGTTLKQTDTLASSITDIRDVSSSTCHLSVQPQPPYIQPEQESNMVENLFLEYNISEPDECVEAINELEAELEVELERLQLCLDGETAFEDTQRERIKVAVEESYTKSHSTSFGEIIDPEGVSPDISFGVPPAELERKLHELLEARLQERVVELESALECARQNLTEKEVEITWWKDTACLISRHVPETSRFIFRLDPETAVKLRR